MTSHTVRHRVLFGETDAAGVVYYPNYFRWFDRGTHELLRSLGHPIAGMGDYNVILRDVGAAFVCPLHYDDEIEIESRVTEVRERSFRVAHTVRRGEEITGEGHEVRVWVWVREGKVRPEPLPADLRALLAAP